jgi:hypothetical protein
MALKKFSGNAGGTARGGRRINQKFTPNRIPPSLARFCAPGAQSKYRGFRTV